MDRDAAPVVGEKLPSLDDLVARVPAGALALIDDLFRAKFTSVRKFGPEGPGPGPGRGSAA